VGYLNGYFRCQHSPRALLGNHGQRDPAEPAELAKLRLRSKIPELTEALTGRFGEHHFDLIDQHSHAIDELTAWIVVVMEPFRGARDLIVTIPGISISSPT
jgi:hypothetical protein